jgi:hypothetical protein
MFLVNQVGNLCICPPEYLFHVYSGLILVNSLLLRPFVLSTTQGGENKPPKYNNLLRLVQ